MMTEFSFLNELFL